MGTRFRLTSSSTAPAVSPAMQTYTHTQATRRRLLTSDTSVLTTTGYNPDAADHLVAGDAHHVQFVSDEMAPGLVFTSGDVLKFCIQGSEGNAANNLQVQVFVSVVDAAGTTVRATLRSKVLEGFELASTLTSRFLSTTLSGSYTTVVGDLLVVEFSVSGTPTASGGTNAHNASLRWGGNGSGGDLLENDTQTGTLLNPWIEFTTNITFAAPQTLTGALFVSAPTFFAGTLTATSALTGALFSASSSFFAGTVALGVVPYTNLVVVELEDQDPPDVDTDHFLRANARVTAGAGVIRLRLFQDVTLIATFEFTPTATFTLHSYELAEAEAAAITDYADLQIHLDVKANATPYTPEVNWVGLLRPAPPGAQNLSGSLFTSTPTFNVGAVTPGAAPLVGTLFVNAPTFNVGALTATYALTGTLFTKAPTFFAGSVTTGTNPPTGLTTDEIGAMGHSVTTGFVTYYRTISSQDLIPAIAHGGINARTWGDSAQPGYAAAWAKIAADEPVGGYRAFWVMLGYGSLTGESEATMQGWADHIAARLASDYPTIEYIWWSPQATYFSTNPGDGDAFDLIAIDRWGANPLALDEHAGANAGEVLASQKSWEITQYAIAQGYAQDYGPWVNLTADITDADGRHPSSVGGGDPLPNGDSHGGDILLAFFEGGAQGLAGSLLTSTPTFFVGAMTTGPVTLSGVLFQSTPTFGGGAVDLAGAVTLTGTLFASSPSFPVGVMSAGPVALTGTLFASSPSFPAGAVTAVTSLDGSLFVSTASFPAGTLTTQTTLDGTLFVSAPTFFQGIFAPAGGLFGTTFLNTPVFFVGTITVAQPSFWDTNPVPYVVNPVGYTVNPVAYVKVGPAGPSPWGATLSGDRLEVAPLFPVGSVS